MADSTPRGVKTKLIAVVLGFAGMMDAMLSWRGGFALATSTIVILSAAAALYAVGAIRAQRDRQHTELPR